MTSAALALVLVAAFVHAGWNALAKRAHEPLLFLWSSVLVATAVLLPLGVAVGGAVPAAGLPFVAATILLHAAYFYTLGRAYGAGDFSLVYPVMRGLGVALVPVLAYAVLGERLSPLGVLGIVLVVAGIAVINIASGRPAPARGRPRGAGPGMGWAVATGALIASYSTVDKAGVAVVHPLPYIGLMGAGICALLLPLVATRAAALRREWRENWRTILVASTLNLTSYLLVLFAFRLAKVGYVVAARETSVVVSVLIGGLVMKEGRLGPRLAAAAVILAGVACVAAAR